MEIRFAEKRDIPGLIRLLYQVGDVHHQIRPDIFRPGAIKYTEGELEAILADENRPIFVGTVEDKVLGQSRFYILCFPLHANA